MNRVAAHQKFQEILKKQGHSVTSTRKTVFDVLLNKEPQFMHEVLAQVGSAVDRASVYRTIELFELLGLAQRLNIGWKYKLELSDIFSDHHHHVSCTNCGLSVPIEESPELEKNLSSTASSVGFVSQSHQLEIRGLCPDCQKLGIDS